MNTTPPESPATSTPPQPPAVRTAKPHKSSKRKAQPAGLPVWLPIGALIIALLFAAFIAIRIAPTLSGVVSPPDPVLPPGSVLQSKGSDSIGDWWLYQTTTPGCTAAKFYKDALGVCVYNPSSGCSPDGGGALAVSGANQVAECSGSQSVGKLNLFWRVYISANFDPTTSSATGAIFRIYRDVS